MTSTTASQQPGGNLTKITKSYDVQFKFLTIGDSTVGKSCLIGRFVDGKFQPSLTSTIGVDFKVKFVELDGLSVRLQIWDTAGQERYRAITSSYFRDAMGVLLVFDITSERSFQSINAWMLRVQQNCPDDVVRILVGNKADLAAKREVSAESAKALADRYNVQYFETSAKVDENVTEAFMSVARAVKEKKVTLEMIVEAKRKRAAADPPAAGGGNGRRETRAAGLSPRINLGAVEPDRNRSSCCAGGSKTGGGSSGSLSPSTPSSPTFPAPGS